MTLMMSEMRLLESLMPFMVCTTSATTAPPRLATSEADAAS